MKAAPAYDAEQRFLLVVVSICVLILLGVPALSLMLLSDGWSYRVARITAYPRLISFAFMAAECMLAPLVFCPKSLWFMRLGCFGCAVGAFASFGMAYISRDIDLGFRMWAFQNAYSFYYTVVAIACLLFASAIAMLLYGHMLDELAKKDKP